MLFLVIIFIVRKKELLFYIYFFLPESKEPYNQSIA